MLIANMSMFASADQLKNIQQKQRAAHEKVRHFKALEKLEKNKLYKNQQRLEQASTNLHRSQNQYTSLEQRLAQMERELSVSVAEYNKVNTQMHNRIRQVYKHQRKGMFELIFTAKDINSLLDVIYFERIVLKKDYARMSALKEKSQKIAAMKYEVQAQRRALAQSIQDIN